MIELMLSEKAYLWRKRMKFTQTEAAEYCNIFPPYKWKHLEYGKYFPKNCENFSQLKPEKNEQIRIMRRRFKLNQSKMAKKLGISRQYFNMIENCKIPNYHYDNIIERIENFDE